MTNYVPFPVQKYFEISNIYSVYYFSIQHDFFEEEEIEDDFEEEEFAEACKEDDMEYVNPDDLDLLDDEDEEEEEELEDDYDEN